MQSLPGWGSCAHPHRGGNGTEWKGDLAALVGLSAGGEKPGLAVSGGAAVGPCLGGLGGLPGRRPSQLKT